MLLPLPRTDRVLEWARDNGRYEAHPRLPIHLPCGPIQGVGASGLVDRGVHLLLIPALAVDTRGVRLGQGGGYYDRLLAELERLPVRDIRAVAVVHDDEVLPAGSIHREAHDRRVHGALTPTRFLDFSD